MSSIGYQVWRRVAGESPPACPFAARAVVLIQLALATVLVPSVAAQTVRGELVEEGSNKPIVGAFVLLLDLTGLEQTRAMTDALGRFTLRAPGEGQYRLQAVAVGRESSIPDPVYIAADSTVGLRIEMQMLAVALPALVVEADRVCRVRPEAGVAAAQLWDEARKVLEAVVWTERRGMLHHRIAQYDRLLAPRSLDVLDQQISQHEGVYRGSPFVTLSPRHLAEWGYVQELPTGEWSFDAPDANVLLSDAFADVHCLAVAEPDQRRPDLVGLAFEPVRDREVADVDGVLWLDAESAELRFFEFRYRNLPEVLREVDSRLIGGRVDFLRLPDGPWIVERWWIRMPEVGIRTGLLGRRGRQAVLLAIREQGGWVEEVQTLSGRIVWRAPTAVLMGRITWRDDPLEGADLVLVGPNRAARSDSDGRFRLDSLIPGRYTLVFSHEAVPPWIHIQPPALITIGASDTLALDLALESPMDIWARECPQSGTGPETGMVAGLVRDAQSGLLLPDIRVAITWQRVRVAGGFLRVEDFGTTATTDERGYYSICGPPTNVVLSVEAWSETFRGAAKVTWITGEFVRRQDLELTPRR